MSSHWCLPLSRTIIWDQPVRLSRSVLGLSGKFNCLIARVLAAFLVSTALCAQQPATPKEIFEQGQQALTAARYAEAERDFNRLLEMGVRTAPVYVNLGVAYSRMGKPVDAIRVWKKAKELAPGMAGIDLNLGLAYYKQREFKQAAPYFAAVVAVDPSSVQARYLEGTCRFMMDQFDAAVAAFQPIADREQTDLEFLYMLGISYGKLKRPADSQRTFARLVEAGGETPHLHLLLGKADFALEDYRSAQAELQKAAAGGSRLPYAHYYLGVVYEKQGKFEAAASEFTKETEISPNDHWAYDDLARIKLDQGDPDGAISLLERAIIRNPDAPTLLSALAKAYLEKSEPRKAIPCLRHAIEIEPGNGNYHYQLGRAYQQSGRKQDAAAEMAKARALQIEVLNSQMEELSRDRQPSAAAEPTSAPPSSPDATKH